MSKRTGESDVEELEQGYPIRDGEGRAPEHIQKHVAALDARIAEQHSQVMKYAIQRMFAATPAPIVPGATVTQHGLK